MPLRRWYVLEDLARGHLLILGMLGMLFFFVVMRSGLDGQRLMVLIRSELFYGNSELQAKLGIQINLR